MTFPIIPDKFKTLWDVWDLRVAVLVSLFFQILLIFIASLRKRTGGKIVTIFIWAAYLLADWIATFAIGLIANGPSDCGKRTLNEDVSTFWASFLLVHLGGPHTITAFSLEDNELWIRHLLQLFIHLLGIAYVFTQSLPNDLWIPIALVYLAGFIKYVERTRALYLASLRNFKNSMLPPPSAGSDYVRFMEAYRSKHDVSVPVNIDPEPEVQAKEGRTLDSLVDSKNIIELVEHGYTFFNAFKGLIVDLTYGYSDWRRTRDFFFRRTANDAFRIMEVELNFLYDLLYTKMAVVHSKLGFFFRFVCLVSIVIALQHFVSYHMHHKHEIHKIDIYITYTLLIGGIGLDILAIIKLIFSDWTIAALENSTAKSAVFAIRMKLSWDKNYRWSNYISQHSLIRYSCFVERFKCINKVIDLLGGKDFLDEILYKETVSREVNKILNFIFVELRDKALKAEDSKKAKEICNWRGKKVLEGRISDCPSLQRSVEVEFDESVLRWHVATELCYYTSTALDENRRFSKILSEYMLYLLVMRPTLMSAVAGIVQMRFQDTCEEAKKFRHNIVSLPKFCGKLLETDTLVPPEVVKGGTSRSVLFDGVMMAKELLSIPPEEEEIWKIMSKVWVELLSYAASHCRADAHAQQLSKGGELITFVWLLMIHFGMGEQFRVSSTYNVPLAK